MAITSSIPAIALALLASTPTQGDLRRLESTANPATLSARCAGCHVIDPGNGPAYAPARHSRERVRLPLEARRDRERVPDGQRDRTEPFYT